MIYGIGIDIVEINRIKESLRKGNRLVKRVLTSKEEEIFLTLSSEKRKCEFLAGRFAAKEACAKAIGTGIGKVSFQHIEVLRSPSGAPSLFIEGYSDLETFISISHSEHYAVSQVVLTNHS